MRGKEVAAAYSMRADERQMGVPPHWNLYVTVASADETVKKAQSLGANVLAPAFDVMDVGRMAVLQDPAGAVFCVWQPKRHIGARILNEPGALCWSELTTRDPKRAEAFYTTLFGWTARHSAPAAVMEYTQFSNGGEPGVGMLAMPPEMPTSIPSFWLPYFQVEDCDAAAAKAKTLGGSVMRPPQDIPGTGRFAILQDPQGAAFAVFKHAPA
jgi:predicted enzyme related to lactoylglutathione lyase